MNKTIDYFIDSENDLASFEYYFEEELNIKSVTLKSIMFYVAYVDLKQGIDYKRTIDKRHIQDLYYPKFNQRGFNLNDFCDFLNISEQIAIKFHCDKNHIIIELLEDKLFTLLDIPPDPTSVAFKELFGFNPGIFFGKGKYRSPKSVIDTPPILYLRSNLVDKQNTFYNNNMSFSC